MNLELAEVKSTKDYNLFKMINYNREVIGKRVDKIVDSINKYGFLLPILVNETYMVVDGQHRLEAARKANSKVLYIQFSIDEKLLPILVSTVNTTSKNWTSEDYHNMWSALDVEAYVYINKIIEREHMSISIFLQLSGLAHRKSMVKFRNGELRITKTQRERIEQRIEWFNDIRFISESYADFCNSPTFQNAIINCIKHPDYKHSRMMQVLEASPGNIVKSATSTTYREAFTFLYNKGLKYKIRFAG